jgi:hypothetical protein
MSPIAFVAAPAMNEYQRRLAFAFDVVVYSNIVRRNRPIIDENVISAAIDKFFNLESTPSIIFSGSPVDYMASIV